MGKRTIFDMGKNLHNIGDIPHFTNIPTDMEFKAAMDRAKEAADYMAFVTGVFGTGYAKVDWDSDARNPRNMRSQTFDGGTFIRHPVTYKEDRGTVIDLKPGEYQVMDAPKELPGADEPEKSE